MLTFNAIDVETANADRASICQTGIVHLKDGEITDEYETLINPEEWFDAFNVSVHGINKKDVKSAPTLPEVREELKRRLRGSVLVSHTGFDRVAFERAMEKYGLEQLQVDWLDSARIARRAWPEKYKDRGYGLKNVAKDLGIAFKHHNALEDARAASAVVLCACNTTGLDIPGWLRRVKQPIIPSTSRASQKIIRKEGDPEGSLYGEVIVFTGTLQIPRREAANLAAGAGCKVIPNATRKMTMLVIGTQDKSKFKGYEKSSKHRKTQAMIAKGTDIQILSEKDFLDLIETTERQTSTTSSSR